MVNVPLPGLENAPEKERHARLPSEKPQVTPPQRPTLWQAAAESPLPGQPPPSHGQRSKAERKSPEGTAGKPVFEA